MKRSGVCGSVFALLLSGGGIAFSDTRAPNSPVVVDWTSSEVSVGETATLGVELTPAPGWHLYWKNPGDSGLPVQVEWTFSEGSALVEKRGDLQFPRPTIQSQGKLINYGYAGPLIVQQKLRVAPQLAGKTLEVRAKLKWLVCKESCIPGKAELTRTFTVQAAGVSSPPEERRVLFGWPGSVPPGVEVRVEQTETHWILTLEPFSRLQWTGASPQNFYFFPEEAGVVEHAGAQRFALQGDRLKSLLPRAVSVTPVRLDSFAGLLASGPKGTDPAVAIRLGGLGGLAEAPTPAPGEKVSLFWAVFGAFLGGLILNLMPCVFPVLWLKVLALLQAREGSRKQALEGALVYSLGILVSFWILAGALLALRAGGGKLGWGFQLQSPAFVSLLVLLMGIIALNLFGVFEFSLGRFAGVGSQLAHRRSVVGSFFTGVLATVVATPCTAPFMGASIGYALTQGAGVGFWVFTALGLGLAFPFVIFAAFPKLGQWIPKPGPWMEKLRRGLGVPILATAGWLVWVLSLQVGRPGVVWVLVCAALVTVASFAVGSGQARKVRLGLAGMLGVPVLAALTLAHGSLGPWKFEPSARGSGGLQSAGLQWEPWSAEKVAAVRKTGQPVLIDFTAAWCVTCQVNEQVALGDAGVQARLTQKRVALFKADWTQSDPRITEALGSFGRNGVPLYVYYPSGQRSERLWPQLLTPSIVLTELEAGEQAPSPQSAPQRSQGAL